MADSRFFNGFYCLTSLSTARTCDLLERSAYFEIQGGGAFLNKYRIEVPADAIKRLDSDSQTKYSMWISHRQIIVRPSNVSDMVPQIKFGWYGIFAIIAGLIFLLAVSQRKMRLVPLNGDYSIAFASIVLSTIAGTVTFAITFIRQKRKGTGPAKNFSWRSLIPLVVACGMIITFITMAIFWMIGQLFKGLILDPYTASVLVILSVALTDYLMINLAMTLSSGVVTNLMTVMIVGGVGFSMLTNSSKTWWQHNFSFLGTAQNNSNWQFNITLIFSGLLMIMLVDYLFVNLGQRYSGWEIQVLRWLLYALAACVAAIGLFPNDPRYHVLHDRISMWLIYFMLILIIVIRWCLPEVTHQFLVVSYTIGGILATDYLIFKIFTYLSLTAFELIAFILAFAWILLLFQYIGNLVSNNVIIFPIEIKAVPSEGNDSATDPNLAD